MSIRIALYIACIVLMSRTCDAQVMDYNGRHVTCDERTVLDQALNARNVDYFSGWTNENFHEAEMLIESCKPSRGLFGNREADRNQALRFQILNEMKSRLITAEREKREREAREASAQVQ